MRATLTIAGLLNYKPDLFSKMKLPPGVNLDTVIFHIVEECSFLEVLFPNPEYMQDSIGEWSNGMLLGWERFWKVINKEYDPLSNYDRTEHRERKEKVDENTSGSGEVVAAKTAYNEDAFKNTDKSNEQSKGQRNENSETGEEARIFGNIGVTTSQQMLEAELDVTKKLNFYKMVARDFKEKFCVLIY